MRGPPPSVASVQAVFYASIFFNCLPFGTVGGDVARVWLARRFELSLSQIVLSILVDRVLTVAALIMLALATLPTISSPFAVTAWFGGAAILVAGALRHPAARGHRTPARAMAEAATYSFCPAHGGGAAPAEQRAGLIALCFALASGACSAFGAYCIARSLGLGVGPVPMIAVISIMTLVVALPISVAGWGVREISLVALLGLLGVDREAALALSVELGLISTLLSLPGGAVWLTLRDHRNAASPAK